MASPTTSLPDFLKESSTLDYVIVGGGAAGLVLAARLTEDPTVRVGVIEAGKSRLGDMNVESPTGMSAVLHNPEYDWMYKSTPQVCHLFLCILYSPSQKSTNHVILLK
jgi:choline dehydrogenase-like flavoprotein